MPKSNKKKVCIVVSSLANGGAERSSALLSIMLDSLDYKVHVVTILPEIDYKYAGELLNLGEIEKGKSFISKVKKFIIFKNYLKTNNFDFVIDNRSRSSFFREIGVSRLLFNPKKTIYCVRSYNLGTYFVKPKFISRYLYKDAYKIVAVSKQIEEKIIAEYGFNNVTTIYNPVEPIEINNKVTSKPYILFFGRLVDNVKNISLLIQSYYESQLPQKGIDLILLGNGLDINLLKHKVAGLNLKDNVRFVPFMPNPYRYVKAAQFTVLTSHYEGFPRSLIESLALGVPVISVDCMSGPNEIIINEKNGLLVENYNSNALAEAMNRFINDTSLYETCKFNAKKSAEPFSMVSIAKVWKKLLN
ncbi:glycosyltransferase [Ichthyenterobacterium magnum]|uniref:Glycosyltransferase involved in cell wall biosynthesis n=1 Tax=Ichthyenterobacterium magnum TaxID=1230530 RepID=A0A420DVA3_9FLAO|nr:glycosyltransferase [Ichthyenterobacterium magnum]RKE98108.1 glycosyltransferase involved in cell wall biosynthesis [Ichthyenterobacterium magnum]